MANVKSVNGMTDKEFDTWLEKASAADKADVLPVLESERQRCKALAKQYGDECQAAGDPDHATAYQQLFRAG